MSKGGKKLRRKRVNFLVEVKRFTSIYTYLKEDTLYTWKVLLSCDKDDKYIGCDKVNNRPIMYFTALKMSDKVPLNEARKGNCPEGPKKWW